MLNILTRHSALYDEFREKKEERMYLIKQHRKHLLLADNEFTYDCCIIGFSIHFERKN